MVKKRVVAKRLIVKKKRATRATVDEMIKRQKARLKRLEKAVELKLLRREVDAVAEEVKSM